MMQRRHVDLVDVGPLLAVDLDVDEQLVHHRRGGFVLEALVRHDVAPVAGRIADREQDRLAGALGLRQRIGPPRPPSDRIVLVLQQVRTGFARQAIFGTGWVWIVTWPGILRNCDGAASGVAGLPYSGYDSYASRRSRGPGAARSILRRVIVATGTVKWFNPTKGYGFIQPQGGGKDVFVHISAVERAGLSTLNEGQQIEYEIVANRGKEFAENLKVK